MNFQRETAMTLSIDHIEWYVSDAITVTQSLCSVYGFRAYGRGGPETGLPGQRSVLLGQGDIRILLTSGLHEDHPASQFVARHGDGVAVIGLRTDDAAAHAESAGARRTGQSRSWENDKARVVTAETGGCGDVVYRFTERHGLEAEFLPGGIAMDAEPGGAGAAGDLLTRIDHVALCVPAGDLDPTVAFHEQLGFTVIFQEYVEVGAQGMVSKVVQSPSGGVTFTIIEPDPSRRRGQIDDFLAWHGGAGVQHLAFLSHDIVNAVRTFTGRGAAFAATPPGYYDMLGARIGTTEIPVGALRPLGILADRDHWGQMYQIFARSTHIRSTYFHELIERRGARTFGARNIPALYAAKERELAGIREMTDTAHA
jgi:4-hydroxymandelate synthase